MHLFVGHYLFTEYHAWNNDMTLADNVVRNDMCFTKICRGVAQKITRWTIASLKLPQYIKLCE